MSCLGTCGSGGDGYRQIPAMGAANHGLTATLTISQSGIYYWSVQAIDTAFAGSSWAAEGTFEIWADLAINKTVNPASAAPGETITYTLTFTNNGPGIADNVVITDTYQVGLNSPPTSTVTVTVTSDSQINTLPVSLTFTTLDWDRPQTVTVTAIDDVIY